MLIPTELRKTHDLAALPMADTLEPVPLGRGAFNRDVCG